jgi:heat shock protein HtpX
MRVLARTLTAAVGVGLLLVHAAVAVAWFVGLQWLLANPPGPATIAVAFLGVVVVAGYVGYRTGTVRLVASLDAVTIPVERAPALYRRLERLCSESQVDQPTLLFADLGAPNALSIGGPRRGVVVLDRRLFKLLTIDELEGILAHELAHMERLDTLWNTLALTAARLLVGAAFALLFPAVVLLAGVERGGAWIAGEPGRSRLGLAGYVRQVVLLGLGALFSLFALGFLAYSRRQEFAADQRAAELTGNPRALAAALTKIHRATTPREGLLAVLYIHDDRTEHRDRRLSTHPPIDERIDRLLANREVSPSERVSRLRPR